MQIGVCPAPAIGCRRPPARGKTLAGPLLALLLGLAASPDARAAIATLEAGVTGGAGHARHPLDKVSQRKIVRTRIGVPRDPLTYVVYSRFNAGTSRIEVVLARSETVFLSDAQKVVLFGQGGVAWANTTDDFIYPAIDISADGKELHVVALNSTQTDVVYTRNVSIEGAAWQTAWTQAGGGTSPRYDLVTTSAYATTAPSIALDENRRPHVVWTQPATASPFAPNVFYARHTGLGWTGASALTAIGGTSSPQELDPSIDIANGFVHVLYKDDQNTGDATPKTDRYRYVRNSLQLDYSSFLAAVTVMQPAAGQNDTGLPGSIAAKGSGVWVTGSFLGGFANVGYFNNSTTDGASWALDGPGTENDVYECDGAPRAPAPIGLNTEGNDHRLYAIRRDSGTLFAYKWGGATWVDGLAGTCASHNSYIVTSAAATQPDDSLHLSVQKRKLPLENDLAYCWYNSDFRASPARTVDTIYCDTYTGATPFLGPRVYRRSIGTRPDYGSDTTFCPTCTEGLGTSVTAKLGSRTVLGSGTQWRAANRGPGDIFRVSGVNYMVAAVLSDTELVTEQPVTFGGGSGLAYSLRRQETRLQDWANCVAQAPSGICRFYDTASASLVSDDRVEIGYAYADTPFQHSTGGTGAGQPVLRIDGTTTSATRSITLTAIASNRHHGNAGSGVVVDNEANGSAAAVVVADDFVRVEWLEVKGGSAGADGIQLPSGALGAANKVALHANLVHDVAGDGVEVADQNTIADVYNNVVYRAGEHGLNLSPLAWGGGSRINVLNDTFFENGQNGPGRAGVKAATSAFNVTLRNTLSSNHGATGGVDFAIPDLGADNVADLEASSSNNMSTDSTSQTPNNHCGGLGSCFTGALPAQLFANPVPPDLHLRSDSVAKDQGFDIGTLYGFTNDIDDDLRPSGITWDIGADEYAGTTAVSLMSFSAAGSDGAVDVAWATGSEVDNLGFHLYRALSADGPWQRMTSSLIPGQGFSATGASYSWRDGGLTNGVRYFYRLEDVDTRSASTIHGPVWAVPQAGAPPEPAPPEGGGTGEGGTGGGASSSSCPSWVLSQLGASASSYTCETHGDPFASSFRFLFRTPRSTLVELRSAGFVAAHDSSGRIRALVPGFDTLSAPTAPALPLKRVLLDGVVGRKARIHSVEALDLARFPGLRPAAVGYPRAVLSSDGTVRPGRREAALTPLSRGVLPGDVARLAGEGFLGQEKTLTLEMTPLRFDVARGSLVLAQRLRVRVEFTGHEVQESGSGRLGRRVPRSVPDTNAYAFLATSARGLHAVPFEAVFPGRTRPVDTASLRLTRDRGLTLVPFLVLPHPAVFGPGSRILFHEDHTASSTSFSPEVVYALERGTGGLQMGLASAPVDDSDTVSSRGFASFETNRLYAPDVLEIEDIWQWESMLGGASRTKPFTLEGLDAASPEAARLVVFLQGGSDAASVVDHHVKVEVNGALVAEDAFDGAVPHRVEADVPVSLLRSGTTNDLTVRNVGDTGVSSRVFLDRFEMRYPQDPGARYGVFDGVFSSAGVGEVSGISSPAALVDLTTSSWLTGYETGPSLRFRVEAGHRYLAVSPEALLAPRVFFPETTARLRDTRNQADYILIAPRAFLAPAQPLLERRQAQGLSTFAASLEEIASSFGAGQVSGEAVRDFISFAYHSWQGPSPRYVLLLGDANHDPRRFNPASQPSPMTFLLRKTSYVWTVSDPDLAATNGDDLLPDLAIGRLPATTLEQAQVMIAKILDWEDQGQSLGGPAALVADNPDPAAGDFEADLRDIKAAFLQGRETTEIFLGQIGNRDTARSQILDAFNQGLSLISYVGHGGGAVWADENILNSQDALSLLAQSRQPLMLTMSCLNGYFIAPYYDSLAEGFLKAPAKGTVASFSPSGLSLDGPAHLYHRALMQEITAGQHRRLGDAVLAAQKTYALSGVMPELLSLYHLFGDPATTIQAP